MNKLGFAIKLASQGAGNAIECNKGQWTNKVVDIREYLKLFNGLQGTDNIVTFMSFDEGGCFLTQLRAISGRLGDFLSGWIYIPNTVDASGEDILSAYNYVRNILSQSNLTEFKEDIESFFSKEYPSNENIVQYQASKGNLYGVRYIGYYSLKEIVGTHRYQSYYCQYKAVFLLNKEDEVTITKEALSSFKDLTAAEITETAILLPPSKIQLERLGRGVQLRKPDGSKFDSPIITTIGAKEILHLSRIGFETLVCQITINKEKQEIDFSNENLTWKKRIAPSMFYVCNKQYKKIDNGVQIFINGTDVTYQEILLAEKDCVQALIKVCAPDYEPFEQYKNLLSETCEIMLSRKVKSFQSMVELADGSVAKLTIESKNLSSKEASPLKGYELDYYQGDRILSMNSWYDWKQRLIGFGAAIALISLFLGGIAFVSWWDSHEFRLGWPPVQEIQRQQVGNSRENNLNNQTTGSIEEAIVSNDVNTSVQDSDSEANNRVLDYMRNNSKWSKAELESAPCTKGLFDKINTYKFIELAKIDTYEIPELEKIKQLSNDFQQTGKTLSGQYAVSDLTITVSSWINHVKSKMNPPSTSGNKNPVVTESEKKDEFSGTNNL